MEVSSVLSDVGHANAVFLQSVHILLLVPLIGVALIVPWLAGKFSGKAITFGSCRVLALLTVAALGVRLVYLKVPITNETPDEFNNVFRAMVMLYSNLDPNYFIHPSLYYYLSGFLYSMLYQLGGFENDYAFLHYFVAHEETFVVLLRLISTTAGTATILLVYRIGVWMAGRRAGVLSAMVFLLLPLQVTYSHKIRVDALFSFLTLLSVHSILKLSQQRDRRHYLWTGVFIGLTCSTNYNGGLLVLLLGFVHLFPMEHDAPRRRTDLALAAVTAIVTFLLTSPFVVLNYPRFLKQFAFQSNLALVQHPFSERFAHPAYYFEVVMEQGVIFASFSFIALFFLLWKQRVKAMVLLSFPVAYFLLFTFIQTKYDRFILPVLPFFAVAVGCLLGEMMARGSLLKLASVPVLALLIGEMGLKNVRNMKEVYSITADPRDEVRRYLLRSLPAGSRIFIQADLLPLEQFIYHDSSLENDFTRKLYVAYKQTYGGPDFEWEKCQFIEGDRCYDTSTLERTDVVIISSSVEEYILNNRKRYERIAQFFDALSTRATLQQSFAYPRPVNSAYREVKIYRTVQ